MNFIKVSYLKFRHSFSRHWPFFYQLCERRKAIIKFVLVGSLSGALDLFLLYVFYSLWGWGIVLSTTVAFIFAFLVSFTLQKLWTFRDYRQDRLAGQISLYLGNAFIAININGFLMHLLVSKYGLWYLLAQVLVNLLIASQNFLVYKFIVFKPEKKNFQDEDKIIFKTDFSNSDSSQNSLISGRVQNSLTQPAQNSLASGSAQNSLTHLNSSASLKAKQDFHEI